MNTGSVSRGDLLRLVGVMGVAVGLAWAFQILVLGGDAEGARLLWVVAAATISGAGVGAMAVSGQLVDDESVAMQA